MLRFLGYYKGDINSIFEAKTTEAVEAFKKDNFLDVTGIADERTQVILAMKSAVVRE